MPASDPSMIERLRNMADGIEADSRILTGRTAPGVTSSRRSQFLRDVADRIEALGTALDHATAQRDKLAADAPTWDESRGEWVVSETPLVDTEDEDLPALGAAAQRLDVGRADFRQKYHFGTLEEVLICVADLREGDLVRGPGDDWAPVTEVSHRPEDHTDIPGWVTYQLPGHPHLTSSAPSVPMIVRPAR